MSLKRRTAVLALTWICLFAIASAAIAARNSRPSAVLLSVSQQQTYEAKIALKELYLQPHASNVIEMDDLAKSDPAFSDELRNQIFANRDALRSCKDSVMLGSTRKTEYINVSFALSQDADGSFHMDETQVERATLSLTNTSRDCILDAFRKMALHFNAADAPPTTRVGFTFCFNNRATSDSE